MPKPKPKSAGFSLIELMFTMVFMTVMVLGIVKLQTSGLALGHSQNLRLKAGDWAKNGIQILESIGWGGLPACSPGPCGKKISAATPYSLVDITNTGAEGLIEGLFDRTILLNPLQAPLDGIIVTARIEWEDSTGWHRCTVAESGCIEVKKILYAPAP